MQVRGSSRVAVLVAGMLAVATFAFPAAQAREAVSDHAYIPFANMNGIKNWRSEGNDAILVEGRNDRWYRATFFGPCVELPWQTGVAFVTEPGGRLDRFSSVIAGSQRCYFKAFEEIPAPE